MAQITINEISDNVTYNITDSSYATVAFPITSCWGPGFFDPDLVISDDEAEDLDEKTELELESVTWEHFEATSEGLESFVTTYRGASENYKLSKDYSYYIALTLLSAGYDVLVCRLCPGVYATSSEITVLDSEGTEVSNCTLQLKAKYPGTFGNNLICNLYKPTNRNYWNLVTYVKDSSGTKTAMENLSFVFDQDNSTSSICHIDELESNFIDIVYTGDILDTYDFQTEGVSTKKGISFSGGTDRGSYDEDATVTSLLTEAVNLAVDRFYASRMSDDITLDDIDAFDYIAQLKLDAGITSTPSEDGTYAEGDSSSAVVTDIITAKTYLYNEWRYKYVIKLYDLLKDKLAYNPNRIISPGWDDMDITSIGGKYIYNNQAQTMNCISPIHLELMEAAYYSRCATAYLDVPRALPRKYVYDDSESVSGYAQMLSNYEPVNDNYDVNVSLYSTHSALFAPWGQYKLTGTSKYNVVPPSFLALMIQRDMVLNQSLQYEWIQPTSRIHDLTITKLDYTVPKKVLDVWQPTDEDGGVGVNVITNIPGFGITLWGNTTLYNNPPATYQALRNLSTRHLVCALENVIYKAGLSITFQYNNANAYSTFHASVTPLLDTMVNAGALEDYYVTMAHDLDSLGLVKANSVIGKVVIVPSGVIEKITVDLIALPSGTSLDNYE